MSPLKYLFLVCSIAFFACTDDVAGTWEDENTVAQQSSSSVAESSAESSSSDIDTKPAEIEVYWIDSIGTQIYIGCGSKSGFVTYIESKIVLDTSKDTSTSEAIKPIIRYATPEDTNKSSPITLDSIIEKRVTKLVANGYSESDADSIAKWELFRAIGIDSILLESSQIKPIDINSAINYIFGGTTKSDFYKEVKETFTETGTLEQKHYCNFDMSHIRSYSLQYEVKSLYYPNSLFASHILYNQDDYMPRKCTGGPLLVIPFNITSNIERKCLNLPYCNSSIKDTVIKTSFNGIGERAFICRESGWDAATDKEAETYGIPCDKEGKYIVHSKQPEYSYKCSLDSGWHAVHTIDAETFDVPCDKYGKLYASPNRPNVTYVCKNPRNSASSDVRIVSVCKVYPINPDPYSPSAPCHKENDWEIAKLVEVETANVECDSEGKTYQSPSDTNLYYVCHDKKWTEFYNMPCDTDNMRVKIKNDSIKTKFTEYICFNKKWKRTYKLDYDYPKEYYFNPNFEYGEFEDPRDGQIYRTTEFKGKTWMAENIKYEGTPVTDSATACLEDSCKNVGRFYNASIASEICPEGWRLPDSTDIASFGENPEDLEKLFSQLQGAGQKNTYTAPDTYGMSFKETGRIREAENFFQIYATRLWLNEVDSAGHRRYATITVESLEIGWYREPIMTEYSTGPKRIQTVEDGSDTYRTIRCIKK